jgi:hypothetical protein
VDGRVISWAAEVQRQVALMVLVGWAMFGQDVVSRTMRRVLYLLVVGAGREASLRSMN